MKEVERMFEAPILEELQRKGLKPDSAEWEQVRLRLLRRYAFDLPYYQRVAKIYEHFSPEIDHYLSEAAARGTDLDDHSYPAFEACMEAAKADDESPVPHCLARAVEESSPLLDAFFNRYVTEWLRKQSDGYQMEYFSVMDRLLFRDNYRQEMFQRIKSMLIRDYVLHQWMDRRRDEANREMERRINQLLPQLRRLADLEKSRIAATDQLSASFLQKYEALSTRLYATPLPPPPPEVTVVWPEIARRIGTPGPIVEVKAQGEISDPEKAGEEWLVELKAQAVGVRDEPPPNMLLTPEVEEELKSGGETARKKIIAIEDEIEATVKNRAGEVLAVEKATIFWYDIVDPPGPFSGAISVTVRAEDPGKPEREWSVYQGASVTIDRQVQRSSVWGTALFEVQRDGSFEIEVKPRDGDRFRKPARAVAKLVDPLGGEASQEPQRGQPSVNLLVTLPYQTPPAETSTSSAEAQQPAPGLTQQGASREEGRATAGRAAEECRALAGTATAMIRTNNLQGGSAALAAAKQKNCDDLPDIGGALAAIRREMLLARGCSDVGVLEDSCRFEAALQLVQSLQAESPDGACLQGKAAALQEAVRRKRAALELLRAAENASRREDLRTTLSLLRDSLATAPQCLAALIKPVESMLQQELDRLPAWLEAVDDDSNSGAPDVQRAPSWLSRGGQTNRSSNPDEAIDKARNSLNNDRTQAVRTQLEIDRQRLADEIARQRNQPTTQPVLPSQPRTAASAPPKSKSPRPKSSGWNALANLIDGMTTAVLASQLPGGAVTARSTSTSEAPNFEGIWEGYGALTSSRLGSILGNGKTTTILAPQRETILRIYRSGNGYVLQLPGGAEAAMRYLNGNRIGFAGKDSIQMPERVDFDVLMDLELSGGRMTGTIRMEGSDGTAAARSVDLRRQ
jgi:hypothetical protein